jgi:hypothetical protein
MCRCCSCHDKSLTTKQSNIPKTIKTDEYTLLAEDHAKRQSEAKIYVHEARRNNPKSIGTKQRFYRTLHFRNRYFNIIIPSLKSENHRLESVFHDGTYRRISNGFSITNMELKPKNIFNDAQKNDGQNHFWSLADCQCCTWFPPTS